MADCTFCCIVGGELPATVVARADGAAFQDLNPKAPLHVLVIPSDTSRVSTTSRTTVCCAGCNGLGVSPRSAGYNRLIGLWIPKKFSFSPLLFCTKIVFF